MSDNQEWWDYDEAWNSLYNQYLDDHMEPWLAEELTWAEMGPDPRGTV